MFGLMRISIVLGNNEAPRGLVTLALFGTLVTLIGDSPVAKVNGNVVNEKKCPIVV